MFVGTMYILGTIRIQIFNSYVWFFFEFSILGGIDDPIVLQAALLHDTVEDTETSLDEIEQEFGKIVRDVVDEVTDQKDLPSKERKRLQVINAPKKSPRATLVKLADKLYNLRNLQRSPPA